MLEIPPPPSNTRAFFEPEKLRAAVLDKAKKGFSEAFKTCETDTHKLELREVHYKEPNKIFSPAEQKQTLMERRDLSVPLHGTFELLNKATGKVEHSKTTVVANIPWVTERNTSVINGSEYIAVNQQRLKPGIYTRIKASGEIEAHVNVMPGTGMGGRIIFYPQSEIFIYRVQSTEIKLYGLLRDLGMSDSAMESAWGKEIYLKNKQQYRGDEIDKLYKKIFKE